MTLSQRSQLRWKKLGYLVANVEKYNAYTKTRHDLFGCIDLLAIGYKETIAIQTTSKNNMSSRIRKIEDAKALTVMLQSGWRIVVEGWFKSKNRWEVKEFEF